MRVDEITPRRIAHGFNTLAGVFGRGRYAKEFSHLVADALDAYRRSHRQTFFDYLKDKQVPPDSYDAYFRALAAQYAAKRNRWNQRDGEVIAGKHLQGGAMFRASDGKVEYNKA